MGSVQKRVHTTSLGAIFERPADKVGPWLGSKILDLGRVPTTINWQEWCTAAKLSVQTICFMLNICFPSGSPEFGYLPGRRCLCEQPPVKTLGTETLTSFAGWQHLACVVMTCCWRNRACPVWLFWARTLEGCFQRPPDFAPHTFSLPWLCSASFGGNKSEPWVRLCAVLWDFPENHQTWEWSWGTST